MLVAQLGSCHPWDQQAGVVVFLPRDILVVPGDSGTLETPSRVTPDVDSRRPHKPSQGPLPFLQPGASTVGYGQRRRGVCPEGSTALASLLRPSFPMAPCGDCPGTADRHLS